MVYTPTVWVASTTPGISATNLNNLETQYTEATSYFIDQISVTVPLVPTSVGLAGTSTKWASGTHKHPYGTSTMFADSVASTSILAHSISGASVAITTFYCGGSVARRAGTYTVEMQREGASAVTLYLYINSGLAANGILATTTAVACGNITLAVGDVIAIRQSAAPTGSGVFYAHLYNNDGWW